VAFTVFHYSSSYWATIAHPFTLTRSPLTVRVFVFGPLLHGAGGVGAFSVVATIIVPVCAGRGALGVQRRRHRSLHGGVGQGAFRASTSATI